MCGHWIPRDGGGGGSGVGGRNRDGRGETCSKAGEVRRKTAATAMTAALDIRRKKATEDPPVRNSNDRAGGKYHMGGKGHEESADENTEWREEKTEGLATDEEAKTAGEAGEVGQAMTETAWESERCGAEEVTGGAAASRGNTWKVRSEDGDAMGAGGRHWAKKRGRERVDGRQENLDGESS